MKEILSILADIQENSAPIELSIGFVDNSNHVHHNCIYIKSAPPVVAQKLIDLGYVLNITPQGVGVTKF